MTDTEQKPAPIQRFAEQFKQYGLYLGVIVASVPLLTNVLTLVPAYASDKRTLTFGTSLVSYFAVAIVFSMRRRIGSALFPPGSRVIASAAVKRRFIWGVVVPGISAGVCLISFAAYMAFMNRSVEEAALRMARVGTVSVWEELAREVRRAEDEGTDSSVVVLGGFRIDDDTVVVEGRASVPAADELLVRSAEFRTEQAVSDVLRHTPSLAIPKRGWITLSYLLMFLGAVVTFVWMGVIEYAQSTLRLTDEDLLNDPYRRGREKRFQIKDIFDKSEANKHIYFRFAYNPADHSLVEEGTGPYCAEHDARLQQWSAAEDDQEWGHRYTVDKETHHCRVILPADEHRMADAVQQSVDAEVEKLRGAGGGAKDEAGTASPPSQPA